MNTSVSLAKIRNRLALIWGIGFLVVFALFAVLSVTTFEQHLLEVWAWFMPTVAPTLGVILGSVLTRDDRPRRVQLAAARVVVWASAFYLALVFVLSFAWAWTHYAPLEWYKAVAILLAPIQGIVSGLLGRFLATPTQSSG